jgi:hypothetical protein
MTEPYRDMADALERAPRVPMIDDEGTDWGMGVPIQYDEKLGGFVILTPEEDAAREAAKAEAVKIEVDFAKALREGVDHAREAKRLRERVTELEASMHRIKDNCGQVCPEFEVCEHPACQSSSTAWLIAEEALQKGAVSDTLEIGEGN